MIVDVYTNHVDFPNKQLLDVKYTQLHNNRFDQTQNTKTNFKHWLNAPGTIGTTSL